MKTFPTEVYWGTFTHPNFTHPMHLAKNDKGLCVVTWPQESEDTLRLWIDKYIPDAILIFNQQQLSDDKKQLKEYFDGQRKEFTLPLDFRGTQFQTAVWQVLTQIPFGQTWSYSAVAEQINNPNAVRAVGAAIGANPIPIIVPCHRVIGKNKTLTGFAGGLSIKETLLKLEGYSDYSKKGHARFQF